MERPNDVPDRTGQFGRAGCSSYFVLVATVADTVHFAGSLLRFVSLFCPVSSVRFFVSLFCPVSSVRFFVSFFWPLSCVRFLVSFFCPQSSVPLIVVWSFFCPCPVVGQDPVIDLLYCSQCTGATSGHFPPERLFKLLPIGSLLKDQNSKYLYLLYNSDVISLYLFRNAAQQTASLLQTCDKILPLKPDHPMDFTLRKGAKICLTATVQIYQRFNNSF